MKIFFSLILTLFTSAAYAQMTIDESWFPNQPLTAESRDGLYFVANGDGYESSVVIETSIYGEKGSDVLSKIAVSIPKGNNYAACSFSGASIIEEPSRDRGYFKIRVSIGTSVEGDSGGCLALVKDKEDDDAILALLNYSYVTDY